jgi:autotransporter-associated beta strand protein
LSKRFSPNFTPASILIRLPTLISALACFVTMASAQNLIWTGNGTIEAPGNGVWNATIGNTVWNNGTGLTGTTAWSAVAGGTNAIFGGADGVYAITVGSGVNASNLWFLNSGYTLSAASAQSITLTSASGFSMPQIQIAADKINVISHDVTLQSSQSLLVGAYGGDAGGTLILTNGGSIQEISSGRNLAVDGGGTIIQVQTGSAFQITSTGSGGETLGVGLNTGSSATLSVEGGTVSTAGPAGVMNVGTSGNGVLNVNSGLVSVAAGAAGIVLGGSATGNGTINLNGGTITTSGLAKGAGANAVVNFNGGILKANASNPNFIAGLTAANVRNGGVTIDNGGCTITVGQSLQHSLMDGDNEIDGGLKMLGAGTLTLNGTNTYTGPTLINAGRFGGTGVISGSVTIATGATLSPGADGIGTLTIGGNLALLGNLSFDVNKSVSAANDYCVVNGTLYKGGSGTLTINLLGPAPAAGDSFTLFNKAVMNGGALTIVSSDPDVAWTNKLAINGTIQVMPAPAVPPVFFTAISATAASVFTGGSVTFSGSAAGTPPISYQWQFDGVNIPGANGSMLTLTNLNTGDSGNYSLVAYNASGTVTNLFSSELNVLNLALTCAPVAAGINVSWDSSTAYQYQLLTTSNLLAAWSDSGSAMAGTGGRFSVALPNTNSQMYVRVRATPVNDLAGATLPAQNWGNIQWNDPGGWTTVNVNSYGLSANSPAINASVVVSNILQSTAYLGRRRLYFPAGTYYFSSSLAIYTGDLWLAGAGRDNTVFSLTAPGNANATLGFYGNISGDNIPVTSPLAAGAIALAVADASSFSVGDFIQLYAATSPLTNGGAAWSGLPLTNSLPGSPTTRYQCYSQILRIKAKAGSTLTVDMKVLLDYPASYTPVVRKLYLLQNLKLSDFKFQRVFQPTNQAVPNFQFFQVNNCCVEDFESSFSQREHLSFNNSRQVVLESNYLHDCWVHDVGGYGYGYSLTSCTDCRISNNRAARLRHEIILSAGSCHNVLSYNSIEAPYDYDDLSVCHAGFTYMNLIEGNSFYESTSDGAHEGDPSIDGRGGPGNTWFRNHSKSLAGYASRLGPRDQYSFYDNMIGNVTPAIVYPGVLSYDTTGTEFSGANDINGTITWGQLPVNSVVPVSLYLTNRPGFFPVTTQWPLYGPGISGWGATNVVPAATLIPGS